MFLGGLVEGGLSNNIRQCRRKVYDGHIMVLQLRF